ncbi:MAG: preprotein translocase subunit SecE [Ruminococcus sp.]|nr:preprotein translocase subunit SecE [Ruminococcus sp.]
MAKKQKKAAEVEEVKQNPIAKYFRDLRGEFKKVTWPTRQQTINNTAVVLVTVILLSIFTSLIDSGLLRLMELAVGTS